MPYYIKKEKKKADPKKKVKKPRQPSQATLIKKLDKVFSLYIRLRDSKAYGFRYFRCISCGQLKPFDKGDCGHYYSRAKMATRFDPENCNMECTFCNRFSSDHLIGYRENLIRKIGQQHFDLLRFKANQTYKWSCFELEQLIKYYEALVKGLKQGDV